ncbi:type II secretion system F family protein [Rubrimonas cliftonensis]|uniref:Type II secretion system protein F (GspF) n=1 Tax=Rubrimonas cliftonensis TaxID=89524 RepID=A0A1H4CJ16_9RHOB|nr:type II secretion system F family protein [Rubrimonas cliftonensis]SEA60324.1 type II secretion system protein F (GspF) [Rubrimonas cliftonensis]
MTDAATTDAATTIALIGGLAALAAVAMLVDRRAARRRRVAARMALALRSADADPAADLRGALARAAQDALGPLGAMLSRAFFPRERERAEIAALLVSAGFRDPGALRWLAAAKFVVAGLGAVAGYAATRHALFEAPSTILIAAGAGFGMIVGAILPELALRRRREARRRRLRDALPDVIDLMVIASYAGQSLDMALDRIARELAAFSPDMAGEIAVTTAELQALPERADALSNFAARLDMPEARAFAMTLTQTIRYGSPFSQSLRALGADLRQARIIALEERGAKMPALLTLPLIVFIMPAVFVVVVGPAALSMMALF